MGRESRKLARRLIWTIFTFCVILDGALGEAATSGSGDVGHLDANGIWSLPGPEPELWPWIAGFTFLQGILVLVLIRLRDSKQPQGLFNA